MRLVDQVMPQELIVLCNQTDWANDRTVPDVTALLANMSTVYVAARGEDGQLIGFARAVADGRYRALLEDVIVDQDHRGQGIGQTLVQALLDKLIGVDRVFLMTGGTTPVFYRKFGFQPTSDEMVVMQLDR